MTPSEMEEEIRNINTWAAEVAQTLPLLATKEDLARAIAPLATKEDVADARRYALMLNEAARDDIKLLAEHMVAVEAQMAVMGTQMGAMQTQIGAMQTQLDRIERRLP